MTTQAQDLITDTQSLTGRTALVTGATSGIGGATAAVLAARGAQVAAVGRRQDRLDALEGVLAVPADVTDPDALHEAARRVEAELGRVDLVVANAGVMLPAPIEETPVDEWRRMIATNVDGVLNTLAAFLPGLVAAAAEDRPADLVTISSIAARQRFEHFAVYGASKAAVTGLAEGLRLDLTSRGVRVTNIEPGLVETELADHISSDDIRGGVGDWKRQMGALDPAEVAELIAFVTSRRVGFNLPQITVMPTAQT